MKTVGFLARREGFEPPAFWSVARRSIQLSYAHITVYLSQQKLLYYRMSDLSRKK